MWARDLSVSDSRMIDYFLQNRIFGNKWKSRRDLWNNCIEKFSYLCTRNESTAKILTLGTARIIFGSPLTLGTAWIIGNNIAVDPNAPTGQQQPAQGSALGKGHVRRTRWKCNWTARRTQSRVRSSYAEPQPSIALSKSTTRCRCCSQCFCPCRALVCCITLTQGDALGYERVGLSGRSLSERVNCDIIATPLTQSRFCLQRNRLRSG